MEFIITKPLLSEMLKGFIYEEAEGGGGRGGGGGGEKQQQKWAIKWQKISTIKSIKNKQRKQLEQEQNHRNGHHMKGHQRGEWGEMYRE